MEFSRKSQWLLQSASKLHFWFNPLWTNIDINTVTFNKDNPYGIRHLLISPADLATERDADEIENQIKAYQFMRNYALALDKTDSIIYGGFTTYLLPTVYALLGAFLYGFRLYSRLIRQKDISAFGRAQRALLHRGHCRPGRRTVRFVASQEPCPVAARRGVPRRLRRRSILLAA